MLKLLSSYSCVNNSSDLTKCDEELGEKVKQSTDTNELMLKLTSIITATCDTAFKVSRTRDRVTKGRRVPWWTSELTILRKQVLTLRRMYQRTRNDGNLRYESSDTRKGKYTIRQNFRRKNLNLGKNFAPIPLAPTRGMRCTNRHQGNCKVKLYCQLSKPKTEPVLWT